MEIDNQQPSSSSETESQVEVEDENEPFIDELPLEMLMKILEYLDTKNLFISRLVSRRWSGIVHGIIQTRNDVTIIFNCRQTEDGNIKIGGKREGSSLENFVDWFLESRESPLYTRFAFEDFTPSVFHHMDWLKFIYYFGKKVKCLKFEGCNSGNSGNSVDVAEPWAENLRDLLLTLAPNVQELGFHLPYNPLFINIDASKRVQLFPTPTPPSTAAVQLAHLKVLHLDDMVCSNFTGIITDLLNASVNLQRIELPEQYDDDEGNIESLCLLHSLGKLDCLQTAFIHVDPGLLPMLRENPSFPLAFKLKKLSLFFNDSVFEDRNFWPHAALFITRLFESSKDTLENLIMEPVGFLSPRVKLPKLTKLGKLSVQEGVTEVEEEETTFQVLPPGLDLNEIFPQLQQLDLGVPWTDFSNHGENQGQNVSCLPNLKSIKIRGADIKEAVPRISQVCPNLKEFKAYNLSFKGSGELDNFPQVATAIWTHLKQLESLDLKIQFNSPTDAFPALDSCFTGFSGEYCSRLYELIQAQELLRNAEWGQQLEISESELEAERTSRSILDLTDLKNLKVCLWIWRDEITPDLAKKILKVSEKYAFPLMENLIFEVDKNF